MEKLLSYHFISIFLRRRHSYFFNRSKSDFVELENFKNKFPRCDVKTNLNKYLLNKISCAQDGTTKRKLSKMMITMNSKYNMKYCTIEYLLKSKSTITAIIVNGTNGLNYNTETKRKVMKEDQVVRNISQFSDVQRVKRKEPGQVVLGFIPKEWTIFFVSITGFSGFYTLLVTLGTFLFSKEIYVCDHEYYNGLSMIILCIYAVKNYGPILAKSLDKEIDNYERDLIKWNEKLKQNLRNAIVSEIKDQESMEAQKILLTAKRENVHLQREAEFRKRQMEVYEDITRILNYHVEIEKVRQTIQHKNLIQWVTKEVEKHLTPELKEEYMKLCLADIIKIVKKNEK